MEELLKSIEKSLAAMNWYAALAVALTIPDVCAGLQSSKRKTNQALYAAWFDDYLKSEYGATGFVPEASLSGKDCYALRCALLHNASDEFPREGINDLIQRIKLTAYGPHMGRHSGIRIGTSTGTTNVPDTLTIHVARFCQDICKAARRWLMDVEGIPEIQERIEATVKIHMKPGFGLPGDLMR